MDDGGNSLVECQSQFSQGDGLSIDVEYSLSSV